MKITVPYMALINYRVNRVSFRTRLSLPMEILHVVTVNAAIDLSTAGFRNRPLVLILRLKASGFWEIRVDLQGRAAPMCFPRR